MDLSLGQMIKELVLGNQGLRKRKAEEKAARLSLEAKEKELGKRVRDLGEEVSRLKALLETWGRKTAVCIHAKENYVYGYSLKYAYDTSFADSVQAGTERRRRGR